MKERLILSLFFIFVVFVAGVFDYVSTMLCLSVGFVESNPVSLVVFPSLATYGFLIVGVCWWFVSGLSFFEKVKAVSVVRFFVLFVVVVISWYMPIHNFLLLLLQGSS